VYVPTLLRIAILPIFNHFIVTSILLILSFVCVFGLRLSAFYSRILTIMVFVSRKFEIYACVGS